MNRRISIFVLLGSSLALAATSACGGSSSGDLFQGAGNTSATGGTGGSGTGGSGGSGFGGSGTGGSGTGGSGGMSGGSIACGSASCSADSDFCCYYVNSQQPACNPVGTKCSPSTDLYCDGPEDCPSGQVCCGQLVQVNTGNGQKTVYNEVRCAQSCDYGQYQREFCHDSPDCTNNRSCHQSTILSAYKVCD